MQQVVYLLGSMVFAKKSNKGGDSLKLRALFCTTNQENCEKRLRSSIDYVH